MVRDELSVLSTFLAVAEERSFTRAAQRLGVSASRAQPRDRGLEERSGVRPLARTTRGVAPTDAGERLSARLRSSADGRRIRTVALTARGRELIVPIFRHPPAVIREVFAGISATRLRQLTSGKRTTEVSGGPRGREAPARRPSPRRRRAPGLASAAGLRRLD